MSAEKEQPAAAHASQPVAPATRPAATASRPAVGLAGGISIANLKPITAEAPRLQAEVKPLVQEDLERYWAETAEKLGLKELLADATVHLGEHTGTIEIDAQTVSFHDEFKPHRINVMEELRRLSGMPMLDCKVTPLFVAKDEVIYTPLDKYRAMLEVNPKLAELRKLFPTIDY